MDAILSQSDLSTHLDSDPRILDIRVAEALGFRRPAAIRQLISRHSRHLVKLGGVIHTAWRSPDSLRVGRPPKAYWLNKKQALYICTKSDTSRATEVTIQMVEVYDAYTASITTSTAVPTDTASSLATSVSRLEHILHAHTMAETLETVTEMMRDLQLRNDAHLQSMRLSAEAIERLMSGTPTLQLT